MRKGEQRGGVETRAPRLIAASLVLAASGCADFSPQVADLRPAFGYTPRAVSSVEGNGYYAELCRNAASTDNGIDCPVLFGTLPAALDDADALRLKLLKAELNDSGEPWLATLISLPVGAYALYRGMFGHGDGTRQEIAKLGLTGGAVFTWISQRESRERQSIRIAAIKALSCAMYGTSLRYLYQRRVILGSPSPEAWSTGDRRAADDDGAPSLMTAQRDVRTSAEALRNALPALRAAIAAEPATVRRPGSYNNACDRDGGTITCHLRGQGKPPVVTQGNVSVKEAADELARAEAALKTVPTQLAAANDLYIRISRTAEDKLRFLVNEIQDNANLAVLSTEIDVATLRRSITDMKLGSTGLSGVLTQAATAPASSTLPSGAFSAQAAVEGAASVGQRGIKSAELTRSRDAVRDATIRLESSLGEIQVHLAEDEMRAREVRGMERCSFVPPGLKLIVEPSDPALIVAPGSSLRLTALGGASLPTVSLTGNTTFRAVDILRLDPDTTSGRQSLGVVLTTPVDATDQDLLLKFSNEDLSEVRRISIRKAGAKK